MTPLVAMLIVVMIAFTILGIGLFPVWIGALSDRKREQERRRTNSAFAEHKRKTLNDLDDLEVSFSSYLRDRQLEREKIELRDFLNKKSPY